MLNSGEAAGLYKIRWVSPDDIHAQLERIARSPAFARADRLQTFLRFVVEKTVAGRPHEIKESAIALEVCGRDSSFDPKVDPIVRVDANRLRARLEAYYRADGAHDPVRIALPKGAYVPSITPNVHARASAQGARTVAVLPFVSLGSPSDPSIGDGLAEELIHQLSRAEGLRVIARTSAFQYRGSGTDLRRLRTELGVDYAVEGSVRIAGDQMRVTAQLTGVEDQTVRWSAKYERRIDNVLSVQDDICRNIAVALEVHFGGVAIVPTRGRAQAHVEYLKGRYFWNRRTKDALDESLEHYARAIQFDDAYAPAYCGIADTLLVQALNEQVAAAEAMPRARAHARRALELQPDAPEALVSSGAITAVYDWDWEASDALFRRAIDMNPNFALAHYLFAVVNLAPRALWDDAYIAMDRAIELDPVSPVLYRDLGILHYLRGQYGEAQDSFTHARRLDPGFHGTLFWSARCLAQQHRYAEAIQLLEARRASSAPNTRVTAVLIHTLAAMGRQAEARGVLATLQDSGPVPPLNMAIVHIGFGEYDAALERMAVAVEERAVPLYQAAVDPIYEPLRPFRSFRSLLRTMGLGPALTRT